MAATEGGWRRARDGGGSPEQTGNGLSGLGLARDWVGKRAREAVNSIAGLARRVGVAEGAREGGAARRGSGEQIWAEQSERKGEKGSASISTSTRSFWTARSRRGAAKWWRNGEL